MSREYANVSRFQVSINEKNKKDKRPFMENCYLNTKFLNKKIVMKRIKIEFFLFFSHLKSTKSIRIHVIYAWYFDFIKWWFGFSEKSQKSSFAGKKTPLKFSSITTTTQFFPFYLDTLFSLFIFFFFWNLTFEAFNLSFVPSKCPCWQRYV